MISMFRKKPILKYESSLESYPNTMTPAKKHIPEWYKKIPMWKDDEFFNLERGVSPTVKLCIPFLDALTLGYMITLPYDIYVKDYNGEPLIAWPPAVNDNPPRVRDFVADEKIIPFEHFPKEFTWNYCLSYLLPIGYSAIITHPLNRNDLPFTTLTGVIDGGLVMSPHGNLPFYIKKNFEGIIKQGTPIAQVIPFRQENWISNKTNGLVKIGYLNDKYTTSVFKGWYKKTFWTRKQYD